VLNLVDKNKDGRISLEEFKAVGLDGLPNFDELGAEGHHYDVESGAYRFAMSLFFLSRPLNSHARFPEFFLHHEGTIGRGSLLGSP
jgi:hypothetical protein